MEISKKAMEIFENYCKENEITEKEKEEKFRQFMEILEKSFYDPLEAIGIIAAHSISEPATQMCCDFNEKVVVKFRDKMKIVKIGEFIDTVIKEGCEKIGLYEVFDIPDDIKISAPSLNKNGKIEWGGVIALCRCKSPDYLLEVRTSSGKSIRATDYHSFVIKKGSEIVSISGKDLKIGDELPAISNMKEVLAQCLISGKLVQLNYGENGLQFLGTSETFNLAWEKIAEIKKIKPSTKYVYDMTVENNHTFALSNGLVIHNTMRTYTLATQRDRLSKVTQGLPRLIEIFDAKKSLEKQMKIYLIPEYNTKDKAAQLADSIKAKKIRDVISYDSIDLVDLRIEIEADEEKEKENIVNIIKKANIDVSTRGRKIFIKPKKSDVKTLRKLRTKLLDVHVDGIKGIEEVVVAKDREDWIIQTAGTNLKKVLKTAGVDISRTRTNDIFQVHEVLGIEAARNVILEEAKATLDEQGLDVDIRHLSLLADVMTVDGTVKAIGRYGVSGAKASVLARANFEETKKHLVNASFNGETDSLSGVIENVLVVQVIPIGTGGVKLKVDVEKMTKGR